jgi:hypothetical protein
LDEDKPERQPMRSTIGFGISESDSSFLRSWKKARLVSTLQMNEDEVEAHRRPEDSGREPAQDRLSSSRESEDAGKEKRKNRKSKKITNPENERPLSSILAVAVETGGVGRISD